MVERDISVRNLRFEVSTLDDMSYTLTTDTDGVESCVYVSSSEATSPEQ